MNSFFSFTLQGTLRLVSLSYPYSLFTLQGTLRLVSLLSHASAAAPLAAQAEEIRIHVACLHATAGCALLCVAPWTFPNVARELKNIFPLDYKKGLRAAQRANATGMPPTGEGGCCTTTPRVGPPSGPPKASAVSKR
jgi:hypothetical protein